jgi:Zn-dependent peptidase ImmA (M78 family)
MSSSIQPALAKAKQLLKENFILEPPVDVEELAKNSGVDVRIVTFPRDYYDVSGFINLEDDKPVMYVNSDDNSNRQKFTIAHELGHWLLHEKEIRLDPQKAILFRKALGEPNPDPLEKQANAFAAEVLVPMSMFEKVKNKPVKELATLFEVSPDVIGYRKVASEHVAKDSRTT